MKKLLIAMSLFASFALIGCQNPEPEGKVDGSGTTQGAPTGTTGETGTPSSTSNAPTGGDSGIQIQGAGAGGLAPVTGTDNLQGSGGGGGGVGQAAKSAAKNAAANAGGGSTDQMNNEGE
ncbi:MAG: hypothetical protein ACKVQS_02810 [Fimbriimonadaceae bacterium]